MLSKFHKSSTFWTYEAIIAVLALTGIAVHLAVRFGIGGRWLDPLPLPRGWEWVGVMSLTTAPLWCDGPVLAVLVIGGVPLVIDLIRKAARGEFGSDLLAGISIVVSLLLGEWLAGALVVLMLSGGEALEAYAVRSASSVLEALAKRMPTQAHKKVVAKPPDATGEDAPETIIVSTMLDVPADSIEAGDVVVVFPHEICPVDGEVIEGRGGMDEAYLTGEPYLVPKTPGSLVLSGAVNGASALTIRATRRPGDSRYAQIMRVMQEGEQRRPRIRRLGDRLGAWYTPLALAIAATAWAASGDPIRFLAVLVVATPCPLLIAIPTAIIGSISLAARRGIIIKDTAVLERADRCQVAIFDKTGTLTYGKPVLTDMVPIPAQPSSATKSQSHRDWDESWILARVASLERYSRHPLAGAIVEAADQRGLKPLVVEEIHEPPGHGLTGVVDGVVVSVTHRRAVARDHPNWLALLPPQGPGMECLVLIEGEPACLFRFRDEPRADGAPFVGHLGPSHGLSRVVLLSGDREAEVRHVAERVGIVEVFAGQTPESKLEFVRTETAEAPTLFLGDGVNDAPAMNAATVGLAMGQNSDVTTEAAGAVILESSLRKVDEFLHIARRMRIIALQSALGGMALSMIGMGFAAFGALSPVAGAVLQEIIDVAAILNALRAAWKPRSLSDY